MPDPAPAADRPVQRPWYFFTGEGLSPHDRIDTLLRDHKAPPWRSFTDRPAASPRAVGSYSRRGRRVWSQAELDVVNAALFLRRPLLVEGGPGTGKSMMAKDIAFELGLGEPLVWSVNSRTTLKDGLYGYDTLGRLQEANIAAKGEREPPSVEEFVRLGPLGTALYPHVRPRVLLIDEFDKCDVDLPNDLLAVMEEGEFPIPELQRAAKVARDEAGAAGGAGAGATAGAAGPIKSRVKPHDLRGADDLVEIEDGEVRCTHFPVVIMTSNGERRFPPQFMRRCLRVDAKMTDNKVVLSNIVAANFGEDVQSVDALVEDFVGLVGGDSNRVQALDQLLNLVYLAQDGRAGTVGIEDLKAVLLEDLAR